MKGKLYQTTIEVQDFQKGFGCLDWDLSKSFDPQK